MLELNYLLYIMKKYQGLPISTNEIISYVDVVEPIGGSKPKFSIMTDLMRYSHYELQSLSLTCPAQGSPSPAFRLVNTISTISKFDRTHWWFST